VEEAVAGRAAGLNAIDAELQRYESSRKEDEITALSVDITVKNDGTLDVIETVTIIDRPGGDYREGYYKYPPPAQVKAAAIDGLPGDPVVAGNALYFQRNGAPLPEGEHRITMAYATDSIVVNEPHHDELRFVIDGGVRKGNYVSNASATVRTLGCGRSRSGTRRASPSAWATWRRKPRTRSRTHA
jgi:hypothetical protein